MHAYSCRYYDSIVNAALEEGWRQGGRTGIRNPSTGRDYAHRGFVEVDRAKYKSAMQKYGSVLTSIGA